MSSRHHRHRSGSRHRHRVKIVDVFVPGAVGGVPPSGFGGGGQMPMYTPGMMMPPQQQQQQQQQSFYGGGCPPMCDAGPQPLYRTMSGVYTSSGYGVAGPAPAGRRLSGHVPSVSVPQSWRGSQPSPVSVASPVSFTASMHHGGFFGRGAGVRRPSQSNYPLRATRVTSVRGGVHRTYNNLRPPHVKARGLTGDKHDDKQPYPGGGPTKSDVPDEYVSWDASFPAYAPVDYLAPSVAKGPVWADKEDPKGCKFGAVDGNVDRTSFEAGGYKIDEATGRPLNPRGRTGMTNRGLLGRWGPNHAADPIVTRWAEDSTGGRKVLEFVAIKRNDGGGWAIPGGMVEPGDTVSATLKKEFGEEALNSMDMSKEETEAMESAVDELFKNGKAVYRGYVDDPRNTDNAWMETCAYHFHAEDKEGEPNPLHKLTLAAGDDAGAVAWTKITNDIKLYASHKDFVMRVALAMGAQV